MDRPPLRRGLAALYVDELLARWRPADLDGAVHVVCDHSAELAKALLDGYVDVGCIINPPPDAVDLLDRWTEQLVWVRSRDFVLSPGAPIPLVSWPGGLVDRATIEALERAGLSYRVVFSSADYESRVAAVRARVGLMTVPTRKVPDRLVTANEYYLPALEPLQAGIVLRPSWRNARITPLLDALRSLAPIAPHPMPRLAAEARRL
jgi:DNA-binding transcriptional LysR family regulator